MKDVRQAATADPSYPPILFFYQGTLAEGKAFFDRFWPKARAVSDPSKRFYQAFGLAPGSRQQLFGAAGWASGFKAALKGHGIGRPVGDPWTMPGVFLLHHDRVLSQHDYRHAGDHPHFASLVLSVK